MGSKFDTLKLLRDARIASSPSTLDLDYERLPSPTVPPVIGPTVWELLGSRSWRTEMAKREITAYDMAIRNTASHIRNQSTQGEMLDAFTASTVLAIAFCKDSGEVLSDLVRVDLPSRD
jgi:hypothetical protein